jgi:hypothetical protein
MDGVDSILDEVYVGRERVSRDEIHRRAVAADAPADVLSALDALPEGEYAQDEVTEALGQLGASGRAAGSTPGIPGNQLSDDDLRRELAELHRTRNDTLRHGSDQALANHTERQEELEGEYLRRFPDREVDPDRLRAGRRP